MSRRADIVNALKENPTAFTDRLWFPLAFGGVIPPTTLLLIAAIQTALKVACECLALPLMRMLVGKVGSDASQSL